MHPLLRRHPLQKSFTLVELVMVVAIMAVLAAIAAPRFGKSIAQRRVSAAAKRVVADLKFARQNAMTRSINQEFQFQANSNYELIGVAHPDWPGSGYVVSLDEEPYLARISSVDFGGDATVFFDTFGVPDTGGGLKVIVGQFTKTVTVDADTGAISQY